MTLSSEASQALYADESGLNLHEQLQAAYLRNVEAGLAAPTETTAHVAAAAIAQAAQAPDWRNAQGGNLDPSLRATLDTAVTRTHEVFTTFLNLDVPTAGDLINAGLDFEYCNSVLKQGEAEGKQPELLLVPSLSVEQWKELYRNLEADDIGTPRRIQNGGLYIHEDVAKEWDRLTLHKTGTYYTTPHDHTPWHVMIVPGTERPTETSVTHNNPTYQHQHPTVNDYLTLQAVRL